MLLSEIVHGLAIESHECIRIEGDMMDNAQEGLTRQIRQLCAPCRVGDAPLQLARQSGQPGRATYQLS